MAFSDRENFFFAPIVSIKVFYFRLMPSFTYMYSKKKTPYQIRKSIKPANWTSMKWEIRQGLCFCLTVLQKWWHLSMAKRRCTSIYTCITHLFARNATIFYKEITNKLLYWIKIVQKSVQLTAFCKKAQSFMGFFLDNVEKYFLSQTFVCSFPKRINLAVMFCKLCPLSLFHMV